MAKVNVLHSSGAKFCFEITVGEVTKKYTATIKGTNQASTQKKIEAFTQKLLRDLGEQLEGDGADFSKIHLRKMDSSGLQTEDETEESGDEAGDTQVSTERKFEEIIPFVTKVTQDEYADEFGPQNEKIKTQAQKILNTGSESGASNDVVEDDDSSSNEGEDDFTKTVWDTICAQSLVTPQATPIRKRAKEDLHVASSNDKQDTSGSHDREIIVQPLLVTTTDDSLNIPKTDKIENNKTGISSLDNHDDDDDQSENGSIAISLHTATSEELRTFEDEENDLGISINSTLNFPQTNQNIQPINCYKFLGIDEQSNTIAANNSYVEMESARKSLQVDDLNEMQQSKYCIYSGIGHLTGNLTTISTLSDLESDQEELGGLLKLLYKLIDLHTVNIKSPTDAIMNGDIKQHIITSLAEKKFEHEIAELFKSLAQSFIKALVSKKDGVDEWTLTENVSFKLGDNDEEEGLGKLKKLIENAVGALQK